MPEVINEGVTGFVVHDEAAAVEAVQRVKTLSRATVRKVFEQRFSARTMASGYVETYEKLLTQKREADVQKSRRITNSINKRTASNRSSGGLVQHHFDFRPVDDVAIRSQSLGLYVSAHTGTERDGFVVPQQRKSRTLRSAGQYGLNIPVSESARGPIDGCLYVAFCRVMRRESCPENSKADGMSS